MRKLAAVITAGAVAAVLAIPAFAATKTVRVDDDFFSPRTVTVKKGDTIKWRWVGENPHNVKSTSGPAKINSGSPKTSGTYSRKMTKKGTYKVVCVVHPNMKGTIRVK
jgi:plastocyanin